MLGRGCLLGSALSVALVHPMPAVAAGGPEGLWGGPIEHNGQRSYFGVRLVPAGDGELEARLSMPALGVYDVAVGPATVEGDEVRIGSWRGHFDADAGTLSGQVPRALLPLYDVPFTLRRVESLPPRDSRPPAPERAPRWTAELDGPVWAGVEVAGGLVFAGTDAGTLYALREADGSRAWSFEAGGAIRATPALERGALYLHSDDGRVHRLDPATGAARWSVRIAAPAERIPPGQAGSRYDSFGSAVHVAGETAYVGTFEGGVVALDPETGAERWRHAEGSSVLGTPSTSGGRVFYGSFDGDLVALDAATGEEEWRVTTGGAILNSPTPAGELVVIGNRAYDVLGVRAEDGATAWKHYYWFSWVESTAVVRDGTAYLGSSDGQILQALDAASGRAVWQFPTEGCTWATPAVGDERVYVGTLGVAGYMVEHQARFHAVDRRSGEPLWRWALERPGEAGLRLVAGARRGSRLRRRARRAGLRLRLLDRGSGGRVTIPAWREA